MPKDFGKDDDINLGAKESTFTIWKSKETGAVGASIRLLGDFSYIMLSFGVFAGEWVEDGGRPDF